jgi:hypothetical protein
VLLNVALVGAVAYTGVELRRQWVAAKERQAQISRGQIQPTPAPPFSKLPEVAPVLPSGYSTIAQKLLLHPSRNPDLPVEVPPPPPPPPVRPPLPAYHGMINLGDGPEIILSVGAAAHKYLHPGDPIGDFKLVGFSADEVELEWNGERFRKRLTELVAHSGQQQAAASEPDAAPVAVRAPVTPGAYGPDKNANGNGERACVDGDTTPVGTEKDGVVKTIVRNALMGSENCIWKPVSK